MLRLIPLAALTAFLLCAGCATPNLSADYVAAKTPTDVGYSERAVSLSQYQITFRGPANLSQQAVENMAMLRAAEFTEQKNHPWFKLIRRDTAKLSVPRKIQASVSTGTQTVSCSAGTFGCVGTDSPNGIAGVNINNSPNVYDTVYVCVLQIEMGDGPKPAGSNAMDAKATADSLRASVLGS